MRKRKRLVANAGSEGRGEEAGRVARIVTILLAAGDVTAANATTREIVNDEDTAKKVRKTSVNELRALSIALGIRCVGNGFPWIGAFCVWIV
jgi:hypothetical protein